jgi:hypothetical protein
MNWRRMPRLSTSCEGKVAVAGLKGWHVVCSQRTIIQMPSAAGFCIMGASFQERALWL